jgi:ribulose 1,5-bisphosphate synthetase/thiazole synthase
VPTHATLKVTLSLILQSTFLTPSHWLESFKMGETIRRVNGYEHHAYTYYPVLIVGAGASGIAMACRLKDKLGFDQFRIFDRQAGIGGTWWINRYPGAAW